MDSRRSGWSRCLDRLNLRGTGRSRCLNRLDSGRSRWRRCFDCLNSRWSGCRRGLDHLHLGCPGCSRCLDYLDLGRLRSFGGFDDLNSWSFRSSWCFDHFNFRLLGGLRLLHDDLIGLLRLRRFDNLDFGRPRLRCLNYMDLRTLGLLNHMSLVWSCDVDHLGLWSARNLNLDILSSFQGRLAEYFA